MKVEPLSLSFRIEGAQCQQLKEIDKGVKIKVKENLL